MNRANPEINFDGNVQLNSLELGTVLIGSQSVPAVRFVLRQSNRKYSLLATGKQAGELFAYKIAAQDKGLQNLEAHVVALPRPVGCSNYLVVDCGSEGESSINWHSGSELRASAMRILTELMKGAAVAACPVIESPFVIFDAEE